MHSTENLCNHTFNILFLKLTEILPFRSSKNRKVPMKKCPALVFLLPMLIALAFTIMLFGAYEIATLFTKPIGTKSVFMSEEDTDFRNRVYESVNMKWFFQNLSFYFCPATTSQHKPIAKFWVTDFDSSSIYFLWKIKMFYKFRNCFSKKKAIENYSVLSSNILINIHYHFWSQVDI